MQLHEAACAASAVDTKIKELIALGTSIAIRREGCIAFRVHDAIASGATDEEILNTLEVAIFMAAAPPSCTGPTRSTAMTQSRAEQKWTALPVARARPHT